MLATIFLHFHITGHKDVILKIASSLLEDTKNLASKHATPDKNLADIAKDSLNSITRLSEGVKAGAASLGSKHNEAQVMLLNAFKDVATSLSELMQSRKNTFTKTRKGQAANQLTETAQVNYCLHTNCHYFHFFITFIEGVKKNR